MQATGMLNEILRLPISERKYIVERTKHSIRSEENSHSLDAILNLMADEYRNNKELTAFTELDSID